MAGWVSNAHASRVVWSDFMRSLKGLFILSSEAYSLIYGAEEREKIANLLDLVAPAQTRESILSHPELLCAVNVILSGWEAPVMDAAFLDAAPQLEAVFYGAGATAPWITEHVWNRGVVVASAYAANAVPVAEYSLAMILFSLKHGWSLARKTRELRIFPDRNGAPGCFGTTVGLGLPRHHSTHPRQVAARFRSSRHRIRPVRQSR